MVVVAGTTLVTVEVMHSYANVLSAVEVECEVEWYVDVLVELVVVVVWDVEVVVVV